MVETDTFSMVAIREESLRTLCDDYSGSLLRPFYHSFSFDYFGEVEAAEQLAVERCGFFDIRDLDLEVVNRMLELILQSKTGNVSSADKDAEHPVPTFQQSEIKGGPGQQLSQEDELEVSHYLFVLER